ncbi:hypothetical protein Tco_0745541 [Tanacetum coccineum]
MEEINNFQQEPDETLYQAWERFKELLMKCPQHYLTEIQEVILFYNGLDVPNAHNSLTQEGRSTETSDGLAAIQAQLNSLGREIKKVNEKVYATQVGCEQCKGPHYTKDCPLKEEGKTLEEAYYTQFGKTLIKEGDIEQQLQGTWYEQITKKRTKNEAKTTKPDSEWKSKEKTKSKSEPMPEKATQANPEAKKSTSQEV